MKKVFKKIRSMKLPSSLLIFLAIFVVSIFGLQVSKMYAQSYLSSTLGVQGGASIGGPLSVIGGMGVGTGAPNIGLNVAGGGYFDGVVYTADPVSNQSAALATVYYVNNKISSMGACPSCPPPITCPACDSCNSCCPSDPTPPRPGMECMQFQDFGAPCDGHMPSFGLGVICPDELHFGGYVADSCDRRIQDEYWLFQCCPTLPR